MDRVLSIEDMLERYPGTSRQLWATKRSDGTGPAYFKIGRKIYYPFDKVKEWEEKNMMLSTTEEISCA